VRATPATGATAAGVELRHGGPETRDILAVAEAQAQIDGLPRRLRHRIPIVRLRIVGGFEQQRHRGILMR
jgi:hypothetical protein